VRSAGDLDAGDPVERLPGIGPATARILSAAGVHCVGHLLATLPRGYEDRSNLKPVANPGAPGDRVLVRGICGPIRNRRVRRRLWIATSVIADGDAELPVAWFSAFRHAGLPEEGAVVRLFGRLGLDRSKRLQLVNPEMLDDGVDETGLRPIYRAVDGLSPGRLLRFIQAAREAVPSVGDPVPSEMLRRLGLADLEQCFRILHDPGASGSNDVQDVMDGTSRWHRRLAFDELLLLQAELARRRAARAAARGPRCVVDDALRETATAVLPFRLTGAQRRVVGEIAADLQRERPMARLLQGDVGSGKTVVAALAILIAVRNGFQTALLAPTEILAEQHARSLAILFEPAGLRVDVMTSGHPAPHRREVRRRFADGGGNLVVGTHAIFQQSFGFRHLGLVVIDEQHRFGTAQRQSMVAKGADPHVLVMTATPIPRTLALGLYGDLDVSVIDELPPGRRPVRTEIRSPDRRSRIDAFLEGEVRDGGRAYVVCPVIDESEAIGAPSVGERLRALRERLPDVGVGLVHGRMDRAERDRVTRDFRKGRIQILVSTTVIEVGVDVPEASVMVIEGADRFGLSQLHQLRGRVGRGVRPSWCIAVTSDGVADEGRRRLEVFASTTDGFQLAEEDLRIRGPGELTGMQQWGTLGFRFADLPRDVGMLTAATEASRELAASGSLGTVVSGLRNFHR
jgi:ATP-dependent DNA helicase RecG